MLVSLDGRVEPAHGENCSSKKKKPVARATGFSV
jgi:hypothetical protein